MGRVPKPKKKTQSAPQVDKLLKPAAGIALAMLGYYFLQGTASEIPRIDVNDSLALREVFFGESSEAKDYAVLCHPMAKDGGPGLPVSSVFQDSHDDGSAPAEYVLMDCDHILPDSGKSIYDKFKINKKKRPTVFVSGKVGPPKQVPEKHLKTGAMLTKLLKQMLEPHAAKIEKTKELKEKCLNKDVCGLLLKGGKPEPYVKHAIANLLGKYPKVQFASVDSTVLFVTSLEEYIPEYEAGKHRFVVFKKVSGGLSAGDNETKAEGRLKTSVLSLEGDGVSFGSMSTLVSDALSGSKPMQKIPSLPNIKTRTRKLEEAERQKRDRKKDQARRKATEDKQPPQQTFSANDGTKEGRRLERNRRRAEHNAENNVKPKTPEEIKEMERKRRERMEEESKKWNIGGEDEEETGSESIEEEEDWGEEEGEFVDEDEEEDDEDVLDLD